MGVAPVAAPVQEVAAQTVKVEASAQEAKAVRSLTKKHFKIEKVVFAEETKIEGTTLYLRHAEELAKEAVKSEELVVDMKVEIITPR